jgi:hypothetical protein
MFLLLVKRSLEKRRIGYNGSIIWGHRPCWCAFSRAQLWGFFLFWNGGRGFHTSMPSAWDIINVILSFVRVLSLCTVRTVLVCIEQRTRSFVRKTRTFRTRLLIANGLSWQSLSLCFKELRCCVMGWDGSIINAWLSDVDASEIVMQPAMISKKIYHLMKLLQRNCKAHYVHPPRGCCPSRH